MTGPHLCELEKWPHSTRKPSVYVLCMLVGIYETDVLCPLDLADHESLPQQDRLVLLRRPRAETPFGERTITLMEARGLSLRETARRVACSAGYLSNVLHGRKRPSTRVSAWLDDLLEAGGELITLAATAEMVTRDDDDPASPGKPRGQARDSRAAMTGGLSLSLPFVPGRLVIEVSGPAGSTGVLAAVMTARPHPAGSRWSGIPPPGRRGRRRPAGEGADRCCCAAAPAARRRPAPGKRFRAGTPAMSASTRALGPASVQVTAQPKTPGPARTRRGTGWRSRAAA